MEYPKNTVIEKRIKELEDYIINANAGIKLYHDNIKRAKKEQNTLKKLAEATENGK